MQVDNNSSNAIPYITDSATPDNNAASVGTAESNSAGVVSLFGAISGLITTGINMGTQASTQAFAKAQQNYQVTEQQNAAFLKLIAG